LIVVSAAAERGRTAGLVMLLKRMDRVRRRSVEVPMPSIYGVLVGAKTCVFPDPAAQWLILLRPRQGRAACVRL